MTATKAKTPEPDAPPEEPDAPETPKPSKARQKFLDGELRWNEYLEAENG